MQAGSANAGLYGFGNDLANELQMLSGSIATVLMPKATRLKKRSELRNYLRLSFAHYNEEEIRDGIARLRPLFD